MGLKRLLNQGRLTRHKTSRKEIEESLFNLLGAKVDLVTKKALKPLIKESILKETLYI